MSLRDQKLTSQKKTNKHSVTAPVRLEHAHTRPHSDFLPSSRLTEPLSTILFLLIREEHKKTTQRRQRSTSVARFSSSHSFGCDQHVGVPSDVDQPTAGHRNTRRGETQQQHNVGVESSFLSFTFSSQSHVSWTSSRSQFQPEFHFHSYVQR